MNYEDQLLEENEMSDNDNYLNKELVNVHEEEELVDIHEEELVDIHEEELVDICEEEELVDICEEEELMNIEKEFIVNEEEFINADEDVDQVTIADYNEARAHEVAAALGSSKIQVKQVDVNDSDRLSQLLRDADSRGARDRSDRSCGRVAI